MTKLLEKIINVLEDGHTYTLSEVCLLVEDERHKVLSILNEKGFMLNIVQTVGNGELLLNMTKKRNIRSVENCPHIGLIKTLKNKLKREGEVTTQDLMEDLEMSEEKANKVLNWLHTVCNCSKEITLTTLEKKP